MWQRWVNRSSVAPVRRSLPSTSVQFSKGRFVVTITLRRSYAVLITSNNSSAPSLLAGTYPSSTGLFWKGFREFCGIPNSTRIAISSQALNGSSCCNRMACSAAGPSATRRHTISSAPARCSASPLHLARRANSGSEGRTEHLPKRIRPITPAELANACATLWVVGTMGVKETSIPEGSVHCE